MASTSERLGKRIRELRELRGLTLEQLAYSGSALGSKGYLSEIERGLRVPSVAVLEGLARELDVELVDLFVWPELGGRHALMDRVRGAEASLVAAASRALRTDDS